MATATTSAPSSWVVRVDGYEFTHGNDHALTFELLEDAAQFVEDLRADYGTEATNEVIGLDTLGLPVPALTDALVVPTRFPEGLEDIAPAQPQVRTARERTLELVADALFLSAPAAYRLDLVVEL